MDIETNFKTLKENVKYLIECIPPYRIYNTKTKRIINVVQRDNQYFVTLDFHPRYYKRVLANNFIDNPNNYKYVKFIDGDSDNMNHDNLKWCFLYK